jgi:threonine synthase
LAEGRTRLYDAPWISRFTPHAGSIFIKHEGENPSGSFKDRGMTVLISRAMEEGVRKVICASTGNTSASLAKYGTLAGLEVFVLVGAGRIAEGKLSQAKAYGAVILEVEGDFDLAQALVKNLAWGVPHIMLANSLNPFRLEGQKTILFEMLHQYTSRVRGAGAASERWSSPGWIVLPGGNLGNTSAFGKALRELHFLDMIDRVPRLAVIQAEKANPLERSILSAQKLGKPLSAMDSGDLVRVEAKTVASAIEIGNPVNFTKALKSLDFTKGVVVSVSDEEIMKAKGLIDGFGAGCEPASAASLAGFFRLRSKGVIGSGEDVILLTTGHVLKDPYANMQGPGRIIKAAPEEKAIRRILGV